LESNVDKKKEHRIVKISAACLLGERFLDDTGACMSFPFASPAAAVPPPTNAAAAALAVPDYDSVFRGRLWREISSLADAVWKKNKKKAAKKKHNSSTITHNNSGSSSNASPSSASASSLSWEAQELQASLRRHQDLWINEACSSDAGSSHSGGGSLLAAPTMGGSFAGNAPSSPWQVPPHQRQHYLDHPEQFPEIEIAPAVAPHDPSSSQQQPQQQPPPRRARLNRTLIEQMFQLCHELNVGEGVALALLLRVTQQQQQSSSSASSPQATVMAACRQRWFHEKCLALSTLLRVVQYRLECPEMVAVTDPLLESDLVSKLLHSIRQHSALVRELRGRYHEEKEFAASAHATGHTHHPVGVVPGTAVLEWHIKYHAAQRQSACRVLFYVAYRTQLACGEVVQLVDAVHELSQQLDVLDPVDDVPSPWIEEVDAHPTVSQVGAGTTWNYPFPHAASSSSSTNVSKDEVQWRRELVESVHESSLPDLLRAVSTLVLTAVCALDARAVLTDRTTHADNAFGAVRGPICV
jgi:hypothetical protein